MSRHRDRPKRKRRQRQLPPIRQAFFEIGGSTYLMMDWFELDDGTMPRDRIVLERLTSRELRVYDQVQTIADGVAWVLPLVHKRLGRPPP